MHTHFLFSSFSSVLSPVLCFHLCRSGWAKSLALGLGINCMYSLWRMSSSTLFAFEIFFTASSSPIRNVHKAFDYSSERDSSRPNSPSFFCNKASVSSFHFECQWDIVATLPLQSPSLFPHFEVCQVQQFGLLKSSLCPAHLQSVQSLLISCMFFTYNHIQDILTSFFLQRHLEVGSLTWNSS